MASLRAGLRTVLPKPAPAAKSNAQCCKEYKESLKSDPEKFDAFKQTKKLAHARWLAGRSDEQKTLDRENARKRQAKRRMLMKQRDGKQASKGPQAKTVTRAESQKEEKKREAARERKIRSRLNLSTRKKLAIQKKDRERKRAKKIQSNDTKSTSQINGLSRNETTEKTTVTEKKLHRVSYGRVMRAAREKIKRKRDKASLGKLIFLNNLLVGNIETRNTKNLYKRKVFDDTKVEEFYEEAGINLPSKKSVSSLSMKPKKVLTKTVKNLYLEFKEKNPNYKVSLTTFARRRPTHVLLSSSSAFRQCLCVQCVNPMLKVNKLNLLLPPEKKIKHEDDLVARTLCINSPVKRECVERECRSCGVHMLMDSLAEYIDVDEPVSWNRWEKTEQSPMDQVKKSGTCSELMSELQEEVRGLAKHLTTARWQRSQYSNLVRTLPRNSAVVTVDFAENYVCRFQDEVQSAHWSYRQTTIYPSVLHYRCESCDDNVNEYIIGISDDLTHDSAFVKLTLRDILDHLEKKGIRKVYIWSDGCSSQFKSKLPFIHLTELAADFPNLTVERHFFGSGHGKSLCDSGGGTIKGCATRAVVNGRATIQNASDLHTFCNNLILPNEGVDHKEAHLRRSFLHYTTDDISRSKKSEEFTTLKGSRAIHQLKPMQVGELLHRQLTCFCSGCQAGDGDDCLNKQLVGEWSKGTVTMKATKSTKAKKATKGVDVESTPPDESPPMMDTSEDKTPNQTTSTGVSLPSVHTLEVPPRLSTNQPKRPKSPTEMEREQHFQQLQEKLQATSSFEEFLAVSAESKPGLDKYPLSLKTALTTDNLVKDKTATLLYPSDCPKLTPTKIYGDGNCLPRCASVLAFGHEDNHLEMRVRIVTEMATNSDIYFSDTVSSVVKDLPKKAAMYSEDYTDQVLTPYVIEQLLKKDLRRCIEPGIWMGILHLYATATILNTSIESIYPEGVGCNVRGDLAHCVHPVRGSRKAAEYGIMWTHCKGFHGPKAAWGPNHFVVCVPPCFHSKLTASDFVLVKVPREGGGKNTAVPNLYVAELTTGEVVVPGHGRGAWGVYLVQCNRKRSWKRPNAGQGIFFCPLPDITMVLEPEDYEMEQEGRSIVFTFQNA